MCYDDINSRYAKKIFKNMNIKGSESFVSYIVGPWELGTDCKELFHIIYIGKHFSHMKI